MKNRIAIYADLLRKNLTEQGFGFIKQTSHPLAGGVLLCFNKNGKDITNQMIGVNCPYRLEIKKDSFLVYLFYN